MEFSPDSKILATGGYEDDTVRLWNPATGERITTLTGHTGGIDVMEFSPDSRILATGGEDKAVRLWNVASHIK